MKKNLSFVVIYLSFIVVLISFLRIIIGNKFSVPFVLISGVSLFLLIFGIVFVNEQYEEKHQGYAFLDILPVKAHEIVMAKFALALVADTILVGFLIILLSFSSGTPNQIVVARSFFLMTGCICLMMAAIMYTGIFWFGYTKFMVIFLLFTATLGLVPPLIITFYRDKMDIFITNTINFLAHFNWLYALPVILIVYSGLMLTAIHVKRARSS